jgi:hypothetical protein
MRRAFTITCLRDTLKAILQDEPNDVAPAEDATGTVWSIELEFDNDGEATFDNVICILFDDDRIPYFVCDVQMPNGPAWAGETMVSEMLSRFGGSYGITELWFPGHPELDAS